MLTADLSSVRSNLEVSFKSSGRGKSEQQLFQSDRHPGQGPGTVEEEVCLLDPSSASRRQRSSQRSVGRADSDPGFERMGENGEVADRSFCIDTSSEWATSFAFYERDSESVLGDPDKGDNANIRDARLCFNCGSPDHAVSSCTTTPNYELISLSRQLFNFLQSQRNNNRTGESERIHIVEAWKQQRLHWLEVFNPGQITGSLLREALGLRDGEHDGEWLRNMAIWGYPNGWVAERDPRESVSLMIENEGVGNEDEEDDLTFVIFGEEDGEECLNISSLRCTVDNNLIDERDVSDTSSDITPSSTESTTVVSSKTNLLASCRRWALYPPAHFSFALLPVYNGFSLPPLSTSPSSSSATFTGDRRALWNSITTSGLGITQQKKHSVSEVPPWRLPGAFGPAPTVNPETSSSLDSYTFHPTVLSPQLPPPPPTRPPPPLPPPPGDLPPPLPSSSSNVQPPTSFVYAGEPNTCTSIPYDDANDELDMDMSEDDEE
jgi:zinc finger CCHC domain-containing protein 8